MAVAASFGLASALSVVVLGDESGYTVTQNQKMKIAAIEAMWETEPAPASISRYSAFPMLQNGTTHAAIKVPWLLGLIATRSIDETIPGINELVARARERIASGIVAHSALQRLRANPNDAAARRAFDAHRADLGYGLLLLDTVSDPSTATAGDIERAA